MRTGTGDCIDADGDVSLEPVIKVDIKEEKIRVTYTVPYYTALKMVGGGGISALKGLSGGPVDRGEPVNEKWALDERFPFKEKDVNKKTSSKALVMAHAYSNVIMDKIEEVVKNGLTGNEVARLVSVKKVSQS